MISYSFQFSGPARPRDQTEIGLDVAKATLRPESVRNVQYFVGESRWRDDEVLSEHRRQIGQTLGTSDGVLILDGSDCAKQGKHSVGVQRQWCGELGKVANCQAGIYLGYSSPKGYALLDRRLYMPERWFTPEYSEQRFNCLVPVSLHFQTKNELAWEMFEQCSQAESMPACWITMDEAFGRDTVLLDRIDQETDYLYLAEVPKDTCLWAEEPDTFVPEYQGVGRPPTRTCLAPEAPAPQTVAEIAAQLPEDAWSLHALRTGS